MGGFKLITIDENHEVVIKAFRQYSKTLTTKGSKVKVLLPFQEVAANVSMALIQVGDELSTKTKDDIFVKIPVTMHYNVVDSKKFVFKSPDPVVQMKIRVNATVKQLVSGMNFTELYQTREILSQQAVEKVGKELEELYGIQLKDVIVDQPSTTPESMKSFSGVKESERNLQTALNNAAAQKAAAIAKAEGEKESAILRGQGLAGERAAILEGYADQFNAIVAKGIREEMAQEIVKLAMINDTIRDASTNGSMIITTTDSNNMLSQIQSLGKAKLPNPAAKGPDAP